jgi:hypothetical protein
MFLHRDATADIWRLKIVKALYPDMADKCAGVE